VFLFLIVFIALIGLSYLILAGFLTYQHTSKKPRKAPRKHPPKKAPGKYPGEEN